MCHKLHSYFYDELAAMNPEEVCRRALAKYDPAKKIYRLHALGHLYEIAPTAFEIRPLSPKASPVSIEWGLFILFYLLRAKDIPLSGKWVSEMDLKGGATFFRGPHVFRVRQIAERFAEDLEGFIRTGDSLGGEPVEMGDAAFKLRLLPRVPVVVVLWTADEEFEASAKILMDSTIEQHLPLDVIFGMACELCAVVSGNVHSEI